MSFDPPTSSDSQAYDSAQDAEALAIVVEERRAKVKDLGGQLNRAGIELNALEGILTAWNQLLSLAEHEEA